MSRRNIAVFIDSLDAGGAQKQAFLLAKHIGEQHNVTLILLDGNRISDAFRKQLPSLPTPPLLLTGSLFSRSLALYRFLKQNRTEVLFSYLLKPNFVGGLVGKLAGLKLRVGGIRNSVLDPKKEPIERFLHNHINHLSIFNSYNGRDMLCARGFSAQRSAVIPNCFELEEKEIIRQPSTLPVIISVGRFTEQKDYLTAIKVMAKLAKKDLQFKYVIIGWGVLEEQVRSWVVEYGLSDFVELVIDPKDVKTYLAKADIFFMTSLFEGLSNAVMEAMSFSLPIVATRAGDNDKLVEEEINGYLAQLRDVDTLEQGLNRLLNSHDLRIKLGKASYNRLKKEYSVGRFVERYNSFIETTFAAQN